MKKYICMSLSLILMFMLFSPMVASATTLKEYEDKVAQYESDLASKKAKLEENERKMKEIKARVAGISEQITQIQKDMTQIEKDIELSNKKIKEKDKEIKSFVSYLQVVNSGSDVYLKYIFGADSITNMIYRFSVVEQMTDYNDAKAKELQNLINENIKKKEQLKNKKQELSNLQQQLNKEKQSVESDSSLVEGSMTSVYAELKIYKDRVNYYRNKGCKSNDVIGVTCAVPVRINRSYTSSSSGSSTRTLNAGGFKYPVSGCKVTQGYDWDGSSGSHKGIDIARCGCGKPIYAVYPGTVYYVGNKLDTWGAYMVLIEHDVNGKKVFSQYAHVQANIPVSVGQWVDTDTVVAYMGSTGYSTGCHLHLEMSEGRGWSDSRFTGHGTYVRYIINPYTYIPRG